MSRNTGKFWIQGYRRIPSGSKFLAKDPDIKFVPISLYASDSSSDSSSEEETQGNSKEVLGTVAFKVSALTAPTKREINLPVNSNNYYNSTSDNIVNIKDIPLSPSVRDDMLSFLNCVIDEKLNEQDES